MVLHMHTVQSWWCYAHRDPPVFYHSLSINSTFWGPRRARVVRESAEVHTHTLQIGREIIAGVIKWEYRLQKWESRDYQQSREMQSGSQRHRVREIPSGPE